ncbi:hypothetical protein [Deinococcus murrayi]|uniref:hypothetical protein n=1 Tax=Deinococcus murrayi TaxID=68910 RepID=UPI000486F4C5|nr:hypothetical protein [Deinococcus murrayi]
MSDGEHHSQANAEQVRVLREELANSAMAHPPTLRSPFGPRFWITLLLVLLIVAVLVFVAWPAVQNVTRTIEGF